MPGGRLVFSVEHPIYTAPARPGWSVDAAGRKTWPVDGYLDEGPRVTDWLAKGVVKQHRTVGDLPQPAAPLGFALSHVEEWGPTADQISAHPEWADERSARPSCWWRPDVRRRAQGCAGRRVPPGPIRPG